VRSLVAFGKGQDVDTIFVDGHLIVKEGHVLNADEEMLRTAAPDVLRSLEKAASERDPNNRTLKTILSL